MTDKMPTISKEETVAVTDEIKRTAEAYLEAAKTIRFDLVDISKTETTTVTDEALRASHAELLEALREVISVSDRDTIIYHNAKLAITNAEKLMEGK